MGMSGYKGVSGYKSMSSHKGMNSYKGVSGLACSPPCILVGGGKDGGWLVYYIW